MTQPRDASPESRAGRRGADLLDVVVGVVGRAHGLHGQVVVDVRTDEPERRFARGAVVGSEEPPARLTVVSRRSIAGGRLLVGFAEVTDRTAAEQLRGRVLTVEVDPGQRPDDDQEYYDHQLRGLRVLDPAGVQQGTVSEVVHLPGQDLLAVATPDGERLVPFVASLVPQVDLAAGSLTVVELPGLLRDVSEEA